MGQRLSQDCGACWDPEETARIIRRKKQQKQAIQKYSDLFQEAEEAVNAGERNWVAEVVGRIHEQDDAVNRKDATFQKELRERDSWDDVLQKRRKIALLLAKGAFSDLGFE
mmetsp:Transcript_20985/g.53012  ORF Transcript_20985/g.53012 Transcript_20985/m.53012 type:complete len:111 (+) Transcript_20985:81-413(+)|eukprot:CAMPEP_0178997126 /NCGR_PEP_ID=MMETSP0795-20121207/8756_1 /TAXON_ID=88552 /ORGANISM="Amoebophrya sp., Strain Ameob2" /LENGTH=110 /DNA_ID=CAMNT_0020689603 /DNA_START=60 /DNA_END=392 /DNA_ORIENTATION=-